MLASNQTRLRGALNLVALTAGVLLLTAVADRHGVLIQNISLAHPGVDKLAHFLIHLTLVIAVYAVVRRHWPQRSARRALASAMAVSISFGLLDEGHQYFVGGRDFDLFDIAANLCGTATAATLIALRRKLSLLHLCATIVPLTLFALVVLQTQAEMRHFNAGLLHIRAGDYAAARQSLLHAVAEGSTAPNLYNELAWLELEFLDVDPRPALAYTARALAHDDDNANYLDTRGWALYRNRRYEEALDVLLKAYALDPTIYCIHYHLGAVYHALGRHAEAIRHLKLQANSSADGRFAAKARDLLTKLLRANGSAN